MFRSYLAHILLGKTQMIGTRKLVSFSIFLLAVVFLACTNCLLGQSIKPALFVVNNGSNEIVSFTVDGGGNLKIVSAMPAGFVPANSALSPNGKYLAVSQFANSRIAIFEVNPDATLTEVISTRIGDTIVDLAWLTDEHLALVDRDLRNSLVYTYEFDSTANTLTLRDTERTGGFSVSLGTARGGELLFTNDIQFGTILSFSVNASADMSLVDAELLEPVLAVAFHPSPDGRFLYSTAGSSTNRILTHAIEANGELTALPDFFTPSGAPNFLTMNEEGTILVVCHGADETVHTFLRDTVTGDLTGSGFFVDIDGPTTNARDPEMLGDILFVLDQYNSDNGERGVLTYQIGEDGSFKQLGGNVDTMGSPVSQEIWPGIVLGDINGDGAVDLLDVSPFVAALTDGQYIPAADINCDGSLSLLDVPPFIDLLTGN